jgi:hypothetical protein
MSSPNRANSLSFLGDAACVSSTSCKAVGVSLDRSSFGGLTLVESYG